MTSYYWRKTIFSIKKSHYIRSEMVRCGNDNMCDFSYGWQLRQVLISDWLAIDFVEIIFFFYLSAKSAFEVPEWISSTNVMLTFEINWMTTKILVNVKVGRAVFIMIMGSLCNSSELFFLCSLTMSKFVPPS